MKYFEFACVDYYYDNEEDRFWKSEYYFKKHKQFLEENMEFRSPGLK